MAVTEFIAPVDADAWFEPIGTSDPGDPTGFLVEGVDMCELYASKSKVDVPVTTPNGNKIVDILPEFTGYPGLVTALQGKQLWGIGEIGPGSGLIFFDNGSYEKSISGEKAWRFLEVSREDLGTAAWEQDPQVESVTTGTDIGDGLDNSNAIVGQSGHTDSSAKICLDLTEGGKSDWFLPSRDELYEMYDVLGYPGDGFDDGYLPSYYEWAEIFSALISYGAPYSNSFPSSTTYWTSSEYDADEAYYVGSTGGSGHALKSHSRRIRVIRSFTSVSPSYNLRDVGPSGGWIFYKNGDDYLEVAQTDLGVMTGSDVFPWSNVTGTLIGTTSQALGEGLNNTNEIVGQVGHTSSAAKACLDSATYGEDVLGDFFHDEYYWCSSEGSSNAAYYFMFGNNGVYRRFVGHDNTWKTESFRVRAIRAFTSVSPSYALRDTGPGGGLIFWKSGDDYLECASSDQSAGKVWTVGGGPRGTIALKGAGKSNTEIIDSYGAGKMCADYGSGGKSDWFLPSKDELDLLFKFFKTTFSDWFLPSKDELNLMYTVLHLYGVGNFAADYYFSSSESSATEAWYQDFTDGTQDVSSKASSSYRIRPIRAFTSVSPSYELRDTGPAGGKIFYKSGNNYLECSPTERGPEGTVWSDIETAIGTTSTAVGEGSNNTDEIVAQVGHTTSMAQNCLNLAFQVINHAGFTEGDYSCSTEDGDLTMWIQSFIDGVQSSYSRFSAGYVRAVRRF